jgi:predicted transcriptional regulator
LINRSRNEIISQILETANDGDDGGATKTKIMYKVFLGHDKLQEYLMLLIESDLLSYDSTRRTFKTTEKGLTFLQAYNL